MKVSEMLMSVINKVKEIADFKFVDIYYSQDQRESSEIPDFPAVLINVREMIPIEANVRNFELKPEFGALVYFDGLNTNSGREILILDSVETLCSEISKNSRFEIVSASCIERSPSITIWLVEFKYRG